MNNKLVSVVAVVALLLAIGGYFFPMVKENLGASGTRFPNGISANTNSPAAGFLRGNNILLDQTSATSTAAIACVTLNATSSATNIKLVFNNSFTGSSTLNGNPQTASGDVLWQYGTCP